MITYDDFVKIEIKMGKVISAEKVPETDKLLKLEVDFNPPATPEQANACDGGQVKEKNRTIVSGIAHAVTPEEIIGQTLPFVANLEPRTIKGIESQGMIMVAVDKDDLPVLLAPKKDIEPGSLVR